MRTSIGQLSSWFAVICTTGLHGIAPLHAGTIHVRSTGNNANTGLTWSAAKQTVQAGLNAAAAGDQVWVAAGTYLETITLGSGIGLYGGFAGNEGLLSQRNWTANVTILDGHQAGSVVTVPAGATGGTRIDGFTIRNGNGSEGGGIDCTSSSPTIANNTITGNAASYGGGIECYSTAAPTIINNTIADNVADTGGGIDCYASSPTIVNNTIAANDANYGGGLACDSSSPTVANNAIAGNTGDWGGGFYLANTSSAPTIANTSVSANSAIYGGGIYCDRNTHPTIVNTIVAFNSAGIYSYSASPFLRYNCVYGNTAYDYSGLANPTGTSGNISADPRFVRVPGPGLDGVWGSADDDYGNLRLLAGSPCIDAGSASDVPADAGDLDGDGNTTEPLPRDLAGGARFVDDLATANTGTGTPPIVDMGAYEYLCGDVSGDGHVNAADLTYLAASWGKTTGQTGFNAACDLNHDSRVNVVDLLNLADHWGL